MICSQPKKKRSKTRQGLVSKNKRLGILIQEQISFLIQKKKTQMLMKRFLMKNKLKKSSKQNFDNSQMQVLSDL